MVEIIDDVDRDTIRDMVFDIANDMFVLGDDAGDGFDDMELEDDVGCEVLDMVEFIMSLEDEFGLSITEEETDRISTFGDAIDLIWEKLSDKEDVAEMDE